MDPGYECDAQTDTQANAHTQKIKAFLWKWDGSKGWMEQRKTEMKYGASLPPAFHYPESVRASNMTSILTSIHIAWSWTSDKGNYTECLFGGWCLSLDNPALVRTVPADGSMPVHCGLYSPEIWSCWIPLDGLELEPLLPQSSQCWGYGCAPPQLAGLLIHMAACCSQLLTWPLIYSVLSMIDVSKLLPTWGDYEQSYYEYPSGY